MEWQGYTGLRLCGMPSDCCGESQSCGHQFPVQAVVGGVCFCKHIIRLLMVRREVRYVLASSFDIQRKATGCQALNKVFTSRQHRGSATRGPKVFDVNTKLGLGKESCSALLRCACVRSCLHHEFRRLAFAVYLVMSS